MVKNVGVNCYENAGQNLSVCIWLSQWVHVNSHWLNWKNETKLKSKIGQNEEKVTKQTEMWLNWLKQVTKLPKK